VLWSQTPSNAIWNAPVSGDLSYQPPPPGFSGQSFSMSVADSGASFYQGITLPAGTYTLSFYGYSISTNGGTADGSVVVDRPGGSINMASSPVFGVWDRYSYTFTLASTTSGYVGATVSSAGSASGQFYGFQIEPGTVASPYIPTTSTAVLGQRLDYDPNNVLQQNLLTYSQQFNNAAWLKNNSFIQTNLLLRSEAFNSTWAKGVTSCVDIFSNSGYVDPIGGTNASLMRERNGAFSRLGIFQTFTVLASATYTASLYVKNNAGARFVRLILNSATATSFCCVDVNPVTGAITQTLAGSGGAVTVVSSSSTSVGNGWYRVVITGTGAINYVSIALITSSSTPAGSDFGWESYTGSTSNSVFIWGAQLVQGNVPGDYVATTTTTSPVLYPNYTGAVQAMKVCENSLTLAHNVQQINVNVGSASTTYTYSFFAKAAERNRIAVWVRGTSSTNRYDVGFNLTTGSVFGGTLSGNFTSPSTTITAFGNGWYRCTVTVTTAVGETAIQGLTYLLDAVQPPNNGAYAGDGTSGIYLTGAQLNVGSTANSYVETSSSQFILVATKGLLIEEQRSNLATYSNTFSDASWVAVGTKSVVASSAVSPDGTVNAWTLTDSSAVAFDGIQKTLTVANDAASYTSSIFIAKTYGGTSTTFGINLSISGGTLVSNNARINTDLGTVLIGTATVISVGAWWRVAVPITNNTSGNTSLVVQLYPATNTYNLSTSVAATTGSATIYGAQMEAGTFATSYIPTVASQVTRSRDIASVNTITPWFNASDGTIFGEASVIDISGGNYVLFAFNNGTAYATGSGFLMRSGGASVSVGGNSSTVNASSISANTVFRAAGGYQGVNQFISLNGATPNSNATCDFTGVGTTTLTIGSLANSTSVQHMNGWIRRINYYPTRLPNATLQRLTT